jgi:hypothetical protein
VIEAAYRSMRQSRWTAVDGHAEKLEEAR